MRIVFTFENRLKILTQSDIICLKCGDLVLSLIIKELREDANLSQKQLDRSIGGGRMFAATLKELRKKHQQKKTAPIGQPFPV